MKKIMKLSLINILFVFCMTQYEVKAQTTNYNVYSLFVMNIAKYSAWPAQGVSEFQITVFGKSKVYDELLKLTGSKMINGMPMKVNQTDQLNDIGKQQIIYLSDGKSGSLSEIIKAVEGKPVMIITEREGLFKKGAGFSFILMDNNTLRFDINNTELEKRQIKVSKNLTALANSLL